MLLKVIWMGEMLDGEHFLPTFLDRPAQKLGGVVCPVALSGSSAVKRMKYYFVVPSIPRRTS